MNSSPENPVIGVRSFGPEPALVARHAAAWVEGLQSTGVAACAKHFPGHGDTVVDSHHGLPRVTASPEVLRERELEPFRSAVDAGVATVMTSHVVVEALDPDRPATFSPTVIGLLRDDLGFGGVLVSDALDMAGARAETGIPEAAVRALAAGVALLCLGSGTDEERYTTVHAAVVAAVREGRLTHERVAEAAARVRDLAGRHVMSPPDFGAVTGSGTPAAAPHVVARAFRISDAVRPGSRPPHPSRWCRSTAGPTSPSARSHGARPPWGQRCRRTPYPCADVETYGASPVVARALLAALRGDVGTVH